MEHAFALVRQILHSPLFLAQTTDQQQQTLDQIIATGEISQDDVFKLIQEQLTQSQSNESQLTLLELDQSQSNESHLNPFSYLENLPYNVFVKIIDQGQIKGRDLVHLCNVSSKLRAFCLKTKESVDNQGRVYKAETQYVYRRILDQMGIQLDPDENPSQAYSKIAGGYQLWEQNEEEDDDVEEEDRDKFRKVEGMSFCKQVVKGIYHTLVLDARGKVWGYGNNSGGQLGLKFSYHSDPTQIPNLNNIVQVDLSETFSVALDANGSVWTAGLTDQNGFPLSTGSYGAYNRVSFTKIDLPAALGKIIYISVGQSLAIINERHEAFMCLSNGFQPIGKNVKSVNQKFIGNNNLITVIDAEGHAYFSIKGLPYKQVPSNLSIKKAIALETTLILLMGDGTLYIQDLSVSLYQFTQFIVPNNNNLKFVDIDASNFLGYAVAENGSLYKFKSMSPYIPQFLRGPTEISSFGILTLVPDIINVVKISVDSLDQLAVLTKNILE